MYAWTVQLSQAFANLNPNIHIMQKKRKKKEEEEKEIIPVVFVSSLDTKLIVI